MSTLSGVVAVVADGRTGHGPAVVAGLQAAGATVVTGTAAGGSTDTESPRDAVEALLDSAEREHGRVDLTVLAVPPGDDVALSELTDARWSATSADLDTVLWGMRASLRAMVPRGSGRVVVLLTADAKVGRSGAAAGVAAAHAAYGLVKVGAKEAGPRGVTVNAVVSAASADGSTVGRGTTGEEVAAAVVLLASAAGGGMTGVAFPVDGGIAPY